MRPRPPEAARHTTARSEGQARPGSCAKFLFNLYIPKGENGTTEIDVLMISPKGLFVFESKNYSGWIFGSEHQPKWHQTLPQGRGKSRKEVFYNPIMQNRTHIKHLKAMLGDTIPMYSIITFSDRCTLKNVQVNSTDIHVINRSEVVRVAASIVSNHADALTITQVQELHDRLYPYTQTDDAVKSKHIEDIEQMIHPEPIEPTPIAAPAPAPRETPPEAPLSSLNRKAHRFAVPDAAQNWCCRLLKRVPMPETSSTAVPISRSAAIFKIYK